MIVLNVSAPAVFTITTSQCLMYLASPQPGGRTLKLCGGSNHLPKASLLRSISGPPPPPRLP